MGGWFVLHDKQKFLWGNLPDRLAQKVTKKWLLVYVFIACFYIIFIVLGDRVNISFKYCYIFPVIVSFISINHFANKIRSGHQLLRISKGNESQLSSVIYTFLYFATTCVSLIIIGLFIVSIGPYPALKYFPNPENLQVVEKMKLIPQILDDIVAGSEEVWRFSMMILVMIFLRKFLSYKWESSNMKWLSVCVAVLISSFVFGWMHTFNYSSGWFSLGITLTLASSGLCYAVILIATRRLYLVVAIHIIFDIISTLMHIKIYQNVGNKIEHIFLGNGLLVSILIFIIFSVVCLKIQTKLNYSAY